MWRALLLVVLALPACRRSEPPKAAPPKEEAPPPPLGSEARKWTWTVSSQDGKALVSQTYLGPGKCHVESQGAGAKWSVDECRGDGLQLHFVSPDGKKLLVLDPMPQVAEGAWQSTMVVWLYDGGELTNTTNAGALVKNPRSLVQVGSRFAWLAGTSGNPGAAPNYAEAGFVDGTTLGGEKLHFGFDGSGIPDPVAAPPPPPPGSGPWGCDGMLEWTDARGGKHFTDSASQVPARFKKTLRCRPNSR